MQRRVLVLTVCGLMMSAGCVGPFDSGTGTQTQATLAFAEGYSEDGINARTAVETHLATLENTTYELNATLVTDGRHENFSQRRDESGTVSNLSVALTNLTAWEGERKTAFRQSGVRRTVGTAIGNETAMRRAGGITAALSTDRRLALLALNAGEDKYTGTVTRNGTRLHEYVATEPSGNAAADDETVTEFDGRVLVDASGRIRVATFTRTIEGYRGPTPQSLTLRTHVDTDVSMTRPSWVSQTPSASVSVSEGIVATTNTGDDPISGEILVKEFTDPLTPLSEPVAPGETVYVVPDDETVRVTREDRTLCHQPRGRLTNL